jgi:protein-disulfide isomerase
MSRNFYLTVIFISFLSFFIIFIFFIKTFLPNLNQTIPKPEKLNLKSKISSPQIDFTDPVLGKNEALHTIVVYSDFQCPYSKRAAGFLTKLVNDYPEKVKIVWKDFPNTSLHPLATLAAVAAHCAQEQNKFWQYHDYLFENQKQVSIQFLINMAEEIKLNKNEFLKCLQTERTKPKVESNLNEALSLNLDGTPTIFIDGTKYNGRITYEDLETMIK